MKAKRKSKRVKPATFDWTGVRTQLAEFASEDLGMSAHVVIPGSAQEWVTVEAEIEWRGWRKWVAVKAMWQRRTPGDVFFDLATRLEDVRRHALDRIGVAVLD